MYLDHIHPSLCPYNSPQDHPLSNLPPISMSFFYNILFIFNPRSPVNGTHMHMGMDNLPGAMLLKVTFCSSSSHQPPRAPQLGMGSLEPIPTRCRND